MKRYNESTPLEDRDEYQDWQYGQDELEALPAKKRFATQLRDRNRPIYNAWKKLFAAIYAAGPFGWEAGADKEIDDKTRPDNFGGEGFCEFFTGYSDKIGGFSYCHLKQTDYFNSDSLCSSNFVIHDPMASGIGIGVYYKDGEEAGGSVYDKFIPRLKKAGGAEIYINFAVHCEDDLTRAGSEKQMMNLYTKYLLSTGLDRTTAAPIVGFFNDVINGDGIRLFPGSESVGFYGIENERPTIGVRYNVDVIPTEEQIKNISKGIKAFTDTVLEPLYG